MIILWFRQDLRLNDNPALNAALTATKQTGQAIAPIYILDDKNAGDWKLGGASRWWLHGSLDSLNQSLQQTYGLSLITLKGRADEIINDLTTTHPITEIHWNRCYEPWRIKRDKAIKTALQDKSIQAQSHNASLLFEPHLILKQDGTPYKVSTPYFRKGCLNLAGHPREPITKPAPQSYQQAKLSHESITPLNDLNLIPTIPWHSQMEREWQIGEQGAQKQLEAFLENALTGYKTDRDQMAGTTTSRLSPYLRFGEISPHTVWQAAQTATANLHCEKDGDHFLSELGWREFSYYLLYHFPHITDANFNPKFDAFPWANVENCNNETLKRWQTGQTGYPIVDAAMRELWQTGTMHNRARMIVGSFLTKHLRIHWHHGARWFWDCLLDADLASNSASWQWIAGCGADAAPYFRIFNPITQGEKFDPSGSYTRRFVPEIAKLPNKYLYKPWEATQMELNLAGVKLGNKQDDTYPAPIVDHKNARELALTAFATLKNVPPCPL